MTVNHQPHQKKTFGSIQSQWRRNSKISARSSFYSLPARRERKSQILWLFSQIFCSLNSVARVNDRHVWIKCAVLIICLPTTSFNNCGINPISVALSSVSALVIGVECRSSALSPGTKFPRLAEHVAWVTADRSKKKLHGNVVVTVA